jgi:hypothetical protein
MDIPCGKAKLLKHKDHKDHEVRNKETCCGKIVSPMSFVVLVVFVFQAVSVFLTGTSGTPPGGGRWHTRLGVGRVAPDA